MKTILLSVIVVLSLPSCFNRPSEPQRELPDPVSANPIDQIEVMTTVRIKFRGVDQILESVEE